ncbi:MAG: C-GCAxxG-C-C family protein [Oscillospiraceae bacterium]|jgi:C_GCAxxG_C_C family probable redox protein|nr:C-GCAxxG-C-C family protein [Oscillospiraceae bacterium]
MKKEINIKQVQYDAEEIFRIGGFYCSEAIVSSIRKNIDPDMPVELVASASGFPIGVGRSKCMCGAISGAVIALGYFFGRTEPTTVTDPKSQKCMELAYELQESFRNNHQGTLCCHIHVDGMDLSSGEHKKQCVAFTGEMARKAAELIARELKLKLNYDSVQVR